MDIKKQNEILKQALLDIINPLDRVKRNLKEDQQINGMAFINMIEKRQFYVNIAEEALSNINK